MSLIALGLPDFDQILFKVQLVLKNPQPPANAKRAGNNTKLKAPFTRYDVNFAVALPEIAIGLRRKRDAPWQDRSHARRIQPERRHPKFRQEAQNLTMDPKVYEATRQVGMQIHEEIDAPTAEIYLRVGIYDLNSGKCGTVGAALNDSCAQLSRK